MTTAPIPRPGDRVSWQTYATTHHGTVLERFNADCYLVDRGRTYRVLGTTHPDIDIVRADRLRRIQESN